MATYEIKSPQGEIFEVTAPDDATEDQVLSYAQQNMEQSKIQKTRQEKIEESYIAEQKGEQTGAETAYQAGAQAYLGPATDILGKFLTAPDWYARPFASVPGAQAAERGIQKIAKPIGEAYEGLSPRTKRNIEATGLVGGIIPGGLAAKSLQKASRGSLMTRRLNQISQDVLPGVTKIRPAVESAGHSKDIPVMGGLWKKTVEQSSPMEIESAAEVAKIKGYNVKGSNLDKHNAVYKAIQEEATGLSSALKKEKFDLMEDVPSRTIETEDIFGTKVRGETIPATKINKFDPILDSVYDEISRNATLAGDAKDVVDKVISKTRELMGENTKDLSGLLKVRQEIDQWSRLSDKKFFDKTGARQYAVKEIRDAINSFVDQNATGVQVKESLKRQSALYRAKDVLQEKAGEDIRAKALEVVAPSTLKARAKTAIKHGASYVGLSK